MSAFSAFPFSFAYLPPFFLQLTDLQFFFYGTFQAILGDQVGPCEELQAC